MKTITEYLKTHWITTLALATAIWNYASPTVTDFVHNHPKYAFWFGLLGIVVSFYIKSPASAPTALENAINAARKSGPLLIFALLLAGCTSLESNARDLAAASQGFIVTAQQKHTIECQATPLNDVCVTINKAVYAQNVLIDAVETYCGWPARPTPAQLTAAGALPCKRVSGATATLQAAVNNLNAIMGDLKGAAQ